MNTRWKRDTRLDDRRPHCHPEVFGTSSAPVLSAPSTSTWTLPPLTFEATRILEGVHAGRCDIDSVVQPLSGICPAQIVATARVGGRFQVDVAGPIRSAVIARRGIPVGNPEGSLIEILEFDQARHGHWRSADGADVGGGALPAVTTRNQLKLAMAPLGPMASMTSRMFWVPALNPTPVFRTVIHVCHPPVFGIEDRTGLVGTANVDVERSARAAGRDPELHVVGSGGGDVHRVVHPLSAVHPADYITAAAVGSRG